MDSNTALMKYFQTIAIAVVTAFLTNPAKADQPISIVGATALALIVDDIAKTFEHYSFTAPQVNLVNDGHELEYFCSDAKGEYPDDVVSFTRLESENFPTCGGNNASELVESNLL
ncbi:MAG: hypothetical protein F4X40_01345, partial [Chloroflexi bacterium]|nr:hypothetical protein [Chloroflexota bacterium]